MPKGCRIHGNGAVASVGVESGGGDEVGCGVWRVEVDEIRMSEIDQLHVSTNSMY
jgi:hypothetical protein